MLKRIISAVVLLALVAVCSVLSTETAVLLIVVCGVLCCFELGNALKKLERNPVAPLAFAFVIGSALIIYFKLSLVLLVALLGAIFLADFVICMASKKYTAQDALATLGMLIYPCLPVVAVVYICTLPSPLWVVVFLTGFLSAVSCDTFALFGGMAFGKHKLAPTVSPKKTIEGSISGMVVTVAISAGAWLLFKDYIDCNMWLYMLTVLICTVTSQIGDLSASFIKREAGIKDFGNLIPGHGGMLDRIDSIIFSVPTAYVFLYLFEKIK